MKDAGLPFAGLGTNGKAPMSVTMPPLSVTERTGSVCLQLGALARGEGTTLQEAADDLIRCLLALVMAFRSGGFMAARELPPDCDSLEFLDALGAIASAGGDIRERVFG
jgi:hypothetical protein